MYYLGRSYIPETYISVREDEGGQLSSSLVIIHMAGATKTLLKSLFKSLSRVHHAIKRGLPLLAVHTPQIEAAV